MAIAITASTMAELTATPSLPRHGDRRSAALKRRSLRHALEVASAIILALGGLSSAWSGYQASLLNGQQASAYARAGALRNSAASSATTAGQLADIDVHMFLSWANAYSVGDEQLSGFVQQRFRDEFRPAFEAWLATEPLKNPAAPRSPFELAEYQRRHAADAARLAEAAAGFQAEGDRANHRGDGYARTTVIFALVLFVIAIAQQFRALAVRTGVVVTAGALLSYGLWAVAQLPRVLPD